MTQQVVQKPSYDEWMYWSQVIIDRLTTVVHVYNKPPYPDVFMPGNERQFKVSQTVDLLRKLHTMTDENDLHMPQDGVAETDRESHVIAALQPVFNNVLRRMPAWSGDMQILLKSPWYDNCAGKAASDLFRGPDDRLAEGIGSGMPEHGRLPEILRHLLEREQMGDTRSPIEEHPPSTYRILRRDELARSWSRRNSDFLRTAGRVD
jgi:hypothetical protein